MEKCVIRSDDGIRDGSKLYYGTAMYKVINTTLCDSSKNRLARRKVLCMHEYISCWTIIRQTCYLHENE